ncbi:hypothetical protein SH611_05020 [Geminicoccaceae bacterium 1502E]|nr:hypothetical protein [Geminicoccaceae bacterium 1502E]
MLGFVYILVEGTPEEIKALEEAGDSPTLYKVGKAESRKLKPNAGQPFKPVEKRQSNVQSCNPRPVGILKLFCFGTGKEASVAESAFHREFRKEHGLMIYEGHEWYRSSLPLERACTFLNARSGTDVTHLFDRKRLTGTYEEGPAEFTGKPEVERSLNVYVFELRDEGRSWFRVLATSRDKRGIETWYNTGNPRKISMARKIRRPEASKLAEHNQRVRRLMAALRSRYEPLQSPWATKRGAGWNTLAWVLCDNFMSFFDDSVATILFSEYSKDNVRHH